MCLESVFFIIFSHNAVFCFLPYEIYFSSKIDPKFLFLMLFVFQASFLYDACSAVEVAKPLSSIDVVRSLNFPALLTPPTGHCLKCGSGLTSNNTACDVSIYGLRGKVAGLKFCLRCEKCKINFNYDRYGNKTNGWSLYEKTRPLVEASDVCFVERDLLSLQVSFA